MSLKSWWRRTWAKIKEWAAAQGWLKPQQPNPAPDEPTPVPDPSPILVDPRGFGTVKASFLFADLRITTLDLLSPNKSDAEFDDTVRRCKANGDTHVLVYGWNVQDGPRYGWRVPTTPFADGYAGVIDPKRRDFMRRRLQSLISAGLTPILVPHSDDGGYTIGTADRCKLHCGLLGDSFGDLCCGAMFGIEANEYLRSPWPRGVPRKDGDGLRGIRGTAGEAIEKAGMQAWRNATGKPIAGHYTPGEYKRAMRVGADALFAQFGWLSTEGETRKHSRKAIAAVAPMDVYAAEYDKSSTRRLGQFAVAQGCAGYLNG